MPDPSSSDRDYEFLLRTCMLLEAVQSMHGARSSTAARQVLGEHILAFVRDQIPADRGAILLEDQVSGDPPDPQVLEHLASERGLIQMSIDDRQSIAAPLLVNDEIAGMIYLEKHAPACPFDDRQTLILTALAQMASLALANAFRVEWLQSEVRRLGRDLDSRDELLGEDSRLKELRAKIARVAPTKATVLIMGESGTGKELVARSLHRQSMRAGKPFVVINCAAISESLLESELFGHEKGAFTGAISLKRGRIEAGEGGSVFLDEIGEMPLGVQAKILRVIQNRQFERVGGTRSIPLDVRLLAATNRDLEEAVSAGEFRKDLYYRLNVVMLRTPPLRDRPEDIVPLAAYFASRFGEQCGRRLTGISPAARSALRNYDWPGNVRELENAIEHAVVLGSSDVIQAEDLPEALRDRWAQLSPRQSGMLQSAINAAKRGVVKKAFELGGQDHATAAQLLGVHPNYLYRLLRNLDLQAQVKSMSNE